MARFDSGLSGEGLVPPSAAVGFVLAGIQFSGWVLVPVRCAASPPKRGAGAAAAALGLWIPPRGSGPRASASAGMTGVAAVRPSRRPLSRPPQDE